MDAEPIEGLRGILVKVGSATPFARAFVVGSMIGVAAYAAGLPRQAFTNEGEMRPFKGVSRSPEATYYHFLAVPVGSAAAAALLV